MRCASEVLGPGSKVAVAQNVYFICIKQISGVAA